MARKFFNQKVPNKKKTIIQVVVISVCVIGIGICFWVASSYGSKKGEDAVIELRDSVAIEVNGNLPDKTIFFSELQNVKEDDITINYDKVNASKIGEYDVSIKIYKKKYDVKLKVVDTSAPVLKLKNAQVAEGNTYNANSFVESCTDNSGAKCKVAFYTLAVDQDGKPINYANYKEIGTYNVQIVATDDAGNSSLPQTAVLTITKPNEQAPIDPEPQVPTYCKYGNNVYDQNKILAVYVTENNCAIDLNLYQDQTVLKAVDNIMDNETIKLKNEFQKLKINGPVTVNRNANAILNTAGTGVVGYSVHMDVSINTNGTEEIVASYYVKLDGSRVYSVNKYNLQ